ncbi:hypothetical protein [Microcoleus phage My-WqHQDG]|nr:hypothetical protein [Microcoleus phage My-WqHQDG]
MKALQRPSPRPRKVQPTAATTTRKQSTLPELTLDIASHEQEHKSLRSNEDLHSVHLMDLEAELKSLNANMKAAQEARDAFFKANGYTYETYGSYEYKEYWAVHPLYLCQWVNEGPSIRHDAPEWAMIHILSSAIR